MLREQGEVHVGRSPARAAHRHYVEFDGGHTYAYGDGLAVFAAGAVAVSSVRSSSTLLLHHAANNRNSIFEPVASAKRIRVLALGRVLPLSSRAIAD